MTYYSYDKVNMMSYTRSLLMFYSLRHIAPESKFTHALHLDIFEHLIAPSVIEEVLTETYGWEVREKALNMPMVIAITSLVIAPTPRFASTPSEAPILKTVSGNIPARRSCRSRMPCFTYVVGTMVESFSAAIPASSSAPLSQCASRRLYSPVALASLFLFDEIFGVITNLVGGWLAARLGLKTTLMAGLAVQVVSLVMLAAAPLSLAAQMAGMKDMDPDKKAAGGKLPAGWKADKTGKGEGSVWKVEADATPPSKSGYVLVQTAEGPTSLFNLCVVQDGNYTDLEMHVAFKALKGKDDQGGGLVWRYQDANNYYVTRYNPLESNFRVYKVAGGKRTQLGTADVEAVAGKWHTIRVVHKGSHIECSLNGKPMLDVKDETFKDAGRIGLWTKSDAQTRFAGLKLKSE